MKKLIFLKITFIVLLFTGCEVEEVIAPDDVYEEYTVVQSEIRPNRFFPGVRFTKTLPLGMEYDIKDAELKDVVTYIKVNGVKYIPLHYTGDGLYKPLYDLPVVEGDTYELFAKIGEKYIYSKTKIPLTPSVTGTSFNQDQFSLNASVISQQDEVYASLWIIGGAGTAKANDYFSVTGENSNPGSVVQTRTSSIPEEYRSSIYNGSRYIQVFSFDRSFNKYFSTRTSSQNIDNPYVQGGGSVSWNVQGDKVIGMFIGVTPGEYILVN